MDGASFYRSIRELFIIGRAGLLTAFLAGFGRAIAEVGAIIVVGGNIQGFTRTMTTAIVLETSKGDLALALGLGFILILLSVTVSAAAFWLNEKL
jgi:tungstate transport system permease protein